MVYYKTNPVGIDAEIQRLQKFLYDTLKIKWGITNDVDFDLYGRVYRNQTADGFIPEAYKGNANYQEVFVNDAIKATGYFGIGDSITYNKGTSTAQVYLVFTVNVAKLKPSIVHRADEEIRVDVERLLENRRNCCTITSFETGIDNVFKEFSGWRKKEGIKYTDMHPLHCFRINLNLIYNIQDC